MKVLILVDSMNVNLQCLYVNGNARTWAYEPGRLGDCSPSPPKKFGQFSFLGNDKNLGRRGFWC